MTDNDETDLTERGRYSGLSIEAIVASRKQSYAMHKGLAAVAWSGRYPETRYGLTIAALATWTVCLWLTTPAPEHRLRLQRQAYAAARGTPAHPCEYCGQTEAGSTEDRGWFRCNRCGEPSQ